MSQLGEEEELFTVTTANAQDALIICSAALSFIKSIMAVGTYSYFHLVFAFLELASTTLAFAIFVRKDYLDEERRAELYGNDAMLYLLTFVSGIIIEWMDVLFTYQTVRTYKRMKVTRSRRVIEDKKKEASRVYKCALIMALVTSAIVPFIAFAKANWETDYFAPRQFSRNNGRLMLTSLIIIISCQGIQAIFATLNATNPEGLINVAESLGKGLQAAILTSQILVYIVLARVSGTEAGALAYISMINCIQGVESMAEISRHMVWFQLEHPPKQAPCGDPNTVIHTAGDLLLHHFADLDRETIGYLPVAAVYAKLQELEVAGLLEDGAATAVLALEKIDYRDTVQTIVKAGLIKRDS